MKILHITPHLGGGVGTVIMDWMERIDGVDHMVFCLDYANKKAKLSKQSHRILGDMRESRLFLNYKIDSWADIVLVHYWDHPMLVELLSIPLPDCRMVFWCHKNYPVPNKEVKYPDRFINTSLVQETGIWSEPMEYIWSTGNMDRFLAIEPKPHEGFNIGTVVSKKMRGDYLTLFHDIGRKIPAKFTILGEAKSVGIIGTDITWVGKVDDVAPYLAEMDVFAYPLRPDHYGTCEIALGEAMAAGVVPVVMDNPAERFIVRQGYAGYRCRDEQHFMDTVGLFYKDSALRWRMKRHAREEAKSIYSIDNMIASWNKVFDEMMRSPKTKRSPI